MQLSYLNTNQWGYYIFYTVNTTQGSHAHDSRNSPHWRLRNTSLPIGKFSEPICRLLFLYILTIIDYQHTNNICHLAIKLENIILDDKCHLKLVDFGFSIPSSGRNKSIILNSCGSRYSRVPDIYKKQYDGNPVDLFAVGLI